jgi:hypothetical protein
VAVGAAVQEPGHPGPPLCLAAEQAAGADRAQEKLRRFSPGPQNKRVGTIHVDECCFTALSANPTVASGRFGMQPRPAHSTCSDPDRSGRCRA